MALKEKLAGALGVAGIWIYYGITVLFAFAPLVMLDFPFLVDLLIIAAIMFLPYIGSIANLVLWVWAFIVTLGGPQDVIAIVFYVLFGINALRFIYIFVLSSFNR